MQIGHDYDCNIFIGSSIFDIGDWLIVWVRASRVEAEHVKACHLRCLRRSYTDQQGQEGQLKGTTSCWRVDLHLRRHRDLAVQAFNLENFKHRGEILGLSQEDWLGCTQRLTPCCEKSEHTWSWLPSGFPSAPPITDWPIGQSDDPCSHHHHH